MSNSPVLVWFRRDLRISDNPALSAAQASDRPVIPFYVLDDKDPLAPAGAQRWWLHHSLAALEKKLAEHGSKLILRRGPAGLTVSGLVSETGADTVYWNRRYAGAHVEADKALKAALGQTGVAVESYNGALLREPWEVRTKSGAPYRVFTPFWKSLAQLGPAHGAAAAISGNLPAPKKWPATERLSRWNLTPRNPDWAKEFSDHWTPGEVGAGRRLDAFLTHKANYSAERDRPDLAATSRLSAHLAFGEISPGEIWRRMQAAVELGTISRANAEKFLSELAWRDFSYNLLFYNPTIANEPIRQAFKHFPWRDDPEALQQWRDGVTGVPIVDAGMRQLWRTGWMHNRVRMITASFLVKNLLIPWREGERWFWNTLVDADPANNAASWQWTAGCGADAAPYFRIFNPVLQGEKFDPNGDYVKTFVPELRLLPKKYIHRPWAVPAPALDAAGIALGETYPNPIVDLDHSRKRGLAAYKKMQKIYADQPLEISDRGD